MTWKCVSEEIVNNIRKNKILFKDLPRLSEAETREYVRERKQIIDRLRKKGVKVTQKGNSIFYGNLSEGCKVCKRGEGLGLFMLYKCTRECFFCPIPGVREKPKKTEITLGNLKIKNPDHLVNVLKKWKMKGIGVSGGDPLCMLEKTLEFISKMKKEMGNDFFIWLYTNGDLATIKNLKKLKNAGLNEIRFDLAAREYDLKPVKDAKGIIDVVTVETPAFPEDEDKIKEILPKLKKLGIDYLNLQELILNESNFEDMKTRGYKILVGSSETDFRISIPVYDSEMSALRIMEFAIDEKIGIPVNVCTRYYKRHVQISMKNKRMAEVMKRPHEIVTDTGYLEKLVIDEPNEKVEKLVKRLKSEGIPTEKIFYSKEMDRFEFHPSLLKQIDLRDFKVVDVLARPCIVHEDRHDIYIKNLN
ncbi:MAG: radical SAM protein [Candidatus Aenigmarchaeota archaeon]|nr:radical SAM protein [Candidatus Aenigmarchaeota archaeon]